MIPAWDDLEAFAGGHLLGERYDAASREQRSAARAMAVRDLCAALNCPELPEEPAEWVVAAVGEQMLYLLSTRKQMLAGRGRVTAESIDGVGSCKYETAGNGGVLCERARLFAERILDEYAAGGRTALLPLRRG